MNDALTLPFFSQPSSSYPPTPPFNDTYDGTFTNPQDEFYSGTYDLDTEDDPAPRSMPTYSFPTPPGTSDAQGFNPASSASSYMSGFYTNPSFLDHSRYNSTASASAPNTSGQPGPSTYSRQSSSAEEYLQAPDDEEDDALVKLEEGEEGQAGSPDEDVDNEEPLYVNAKQYHRILKRRAARQRLEELNRLARSRKPYLHESRHRHACSRPRGKGGRFLTAEEIEAMKKDEAAKAAAGEGDGDEDEA